MPKKKPIPGKPVDIETRAAPEWSLAAAKARFSEVVENARSRAQTLTRNGKPVAVVVGIEEWKRRTKPGESLADFFLSSPLRGSNLDMRRDRAGPRDVEL